MSETFRQGDRVQWQSSQGVVYGTVKKRLTRPIRIKGHHVAASEDNPEYLVESEKTGAQAAHKANALKRCRLTHKVQMS